MGIDFPSAIVDQFIETSPNKSVDGKVMVKGKVLVALVRELKSSGVPVDSDVFKDNLLSRSTRVVSGILALELSDGIYIVSAKNPLNTGHALVLEIRGQDRLVYDDKVGQLEDMKWTANTVRLQVEV